jgi:hypothetical protein
MSQQKNNVRRWGLGPHLHHLRVGTHGPRSFGCTRVLRRSAQRSEAGAIHAVGSGADIAPSTLGSPLESWPGGTLLHAGPGPSTRAVERSQTTPLYTR